mgnify:FL=1
MITQPQGYLATPAAGTGAPVLVLHAWWGLNDDVRAYCDRMAAAGFTAFAADIYRGQVTDTIAGAEALSKALDGEAAMADVAAAVDFLYEQAGRPREGVAVVGFSLGAWLALEASIACSERVRAVVVYYGTGRDDYNGSKAAYLGHYAENDPYEERDYVDALEAALRRENRPVTFYHYPGTGHWFAEPGRADAYDPAAAELAWQRTVAFLEK